MGLNSPFLVSQPLKNVSDYYDAAVMCFTTYCVVKIKYYTTVCMRHHQPTPSAEHVDATEIAHHNGHAK